MKIVDTDVLVIGSLRAAIELSDNDHEFVVVSKNIQGKSHSVMAEGGITAAIKTAIDMDVHTHVHK